MSYKAVGTLHEVLSRHADEAYQELDEEQQRIAEVMFRCLTERSTEQRDIRRPVQLGVVATVAGVSPEQVEQVVEVFRRPGRSFVTPPAGTPLHPDTMLDISHESLIREWEKMREWVEQETNSAETYQRLEQTARLWKAGRASTLGTLDLGNALTWKEQEKPRPQWAERYGTDFELTLKFLDKSRQEREEEHKQQEGLRRLEIEQAQALARAHEKNAKEARLRAEEQTKTNKRLRRLSYGLVIFILLAVGAAMVAGLQWQVAQNHAEEAQQAQAIAEQRERAALSGQLAAQAQALSERYPQRSLLLAVEALELTRREKERRVPAAEDALRQTLSMVGGRPLGGYDVSFSVVAISPDNHWLVTGSQDGTARVWDMTAADPASTSVVLRGHDDAINVVAISPDNHWLVTGSHDGTARVWDMTAADPASTSVVLRGHGDAIWAMAFSPDNHWLVTGSFDRTARVWDMTAADPASTSAVLRGHGAAIIVVAIGPDNHWLVTGSGDGTARVWDMTAADPASTSAVLRGHGKGIEAVAISPDNHWLVTGSEDGTARVWDMTAADPASTSMVLRGHDRGIGAMAISPDNHWLVTGSGDGTARVWDMTAADPASTSAVLRGHDEGIGAVAISPDNRWLVTGSGDGTARVWMLQLDELIDLACRTVGRNLSGVEWEQYAPGQLYRKTCSSLPVDRSVISTLVTQAESFLRRRDLQAASVAYTRGTEWAMDIKDPSLNNKICWNGGLAGFAEIVLPACERAVELRPDNGAYRASRGLTRALTGDYPGAIEDFQFYIDWGQEREPEERLSKRQDWVRALEAGQNPFDAETLKALKNEKGGL